jgi:hypothetical protein
MSTLALRRGPGAPPRVRPMRAPHRAGFQTRIRFWVRSSTSAAYFSRSALAPRRPSPPHCEPHFTYGEHGACKLSNAGDVRAQLKAPAGHSFRARGRSRIITCSPIGRKLQSERAAPLFWWKRRPECTELRNTISHHLYPPCRFVTLLRHSVGGFVFGVQNHVMRVATAVILALEASACHSSIVQQT